MPPYSGEKKIQRHYKDRVSKHTPKILRTNEIIKILRVDEIFNEEAWHHDDNVMTQLGYKEFGDYEGMQTWTIEGWKIFENSGRHKAEKNVC